MGRYCATRRRGRAAAQGVPPPPTGVIIAADPLIHVDWTYGPDPTAFVVIIEMMVDGFWEPFIAENVTGDVRTLETVEEPGEGEAYRARVRAIAGGIPSEWSSWKYLYT